MALLLIGGGVARASAKDAVEKAKIEVRGLGWWNDHEQRVSLERLLGRERGATLNANAVEDAAFLLVSALTEKGYAKPTIKTELTGADGRHVTVTFDEKLQALLPRPFAATRVEFHVKRGPRYRFDVVDIEGLHAIDEAAAKEYFLGEKVLIARAAARAYSQAHLRRALEGIEGDLQRRGYAEATVTAKRVQLDDDNGKVTVDVEVHEGAKWEVESLRALGPNEAEIKVPNLAGYVARPWSQVWQQDVTTLIRKHYFEQGYPDVSVRIHRQAGETSDDVRPVTVVARIDPGPKVKIGEIRFEGLKRTHESVLRRRVKSEPGEPLNPLAIDQARFRLARLGVFDSVDVHYDPPDGPVRDPVFALEEGREMEVNLLMGYGSYEEFRGGVEMRQFNLFGRAHQSRLLLVQSVKSTRGEYSYTVPELFGESIDGTARVFGLQRQEVSFLRQEYGANAALAMPVPWLGANATVGYTFQSLRNRDNELTTQNADEKQVNAASVDVNLVRDRRDNPLRPRHGYRWFVEAETASQLLGGSVDYQRVELGVSWHTSWGSGRWIHVGLDHGVITTFGATNDADLPVNKRFFPGGDNSIRGYQVGEAAPIGPDGKYVGAKTYALLNLELEQALTPKWSVVLFGDALGTATRLADYPFDEELYTVGLGVRYQTLIGPLRMEYGRNLNPRSIDPRGTLLFSVGFPF